MYRGDAIGRKRLQRFPAASWHQNDAIAVLLHISKEKSHGFLQEREREYERINNQRKVKRKVQEKNKWEMLLDFHLIRKGAHRVQEVDSSLASAKRAQRSSILLVLHINEINVSSSPLYLSDTRCCKFHETSCNQRA